MVGVEYDLGVFNYLVSEEGMEIQVSNITEESRAINLTVVLEKRGYSVITKKLKSGWRVVAEYPETKISSDPFPLTRPISPISMHGE